MGRHRTDGDTRAVAYRDIVGKHDVLVAVVALGEEASRGVANRGIVVRFHHTARIEFEPEELVPREVARDDDIRHPTGVETVRLTAGQCEPASPLTEVDAVHRELHRRRA
jgi:hypothetical protein